MNTQSDRYRQIIGKFSEKNILVIGDLMLDAYFWGKADRISPEAPVPIIEVQKTNFNPGGAGNVALNVASLGANVTLFGAVGDDSNGDILLQKLIAANIDVSQIIRDQSYQTPLKTRVIAQDQQVVRIDQEDNIIESKIIIERAEKYFENFSDKIDGIIVADYNKGFLSVEIIKIILRYADKYTIPIYVDPKWDNFFEYKNVHFFKPNANEFRKAIGSNYQDDNFYNLGTDLRTRLNSNLLLITRGSKDAILFTKDGYHTIPTKTQSAYDVSGAGDTVISVFALADLSGASATEAANIANVAASIVCSKVGVVPVISSDLLKSFR